MLRPTTFALSPSLPFRALALASFLALGLLGACGGKQLDSEPDSGSGGSDGGGVFTEPDGATCVDIDLSSYDVSCKVAADCIEVASGPVCDGYCQCIGGDATVNKSEEARYESTLAAVTPSSEACPCISAGTPRCVRGTCKLCGFDPSDPDCPDAGTVIFDGGVMTSEGSTGTTDAGTCVDIDLSSYDRTCKKSSECIAITSGELCTGACNCGGSTINEDGEAKYEEAIAGVTLGECPCPATGLPTCVLGMCVLCGVPGSAPGCPDGG